jgi:hypothetical protein
MASKPNLSRLLKNYCAQLCGVEISLKMLMYNSYTALFRLISPCLAFARYIFQRPARGPLIGSVAVLYALFYLYVIGDIDLGPAQWRWQSLEWQWQRLFAQRSSWHFEALALLELGYLLILLSPANMLIAALLGSLLALNLHGALALRERAACRLSENAAWSAGVWPALLAGGACCAPSLLLMLGIPGMGAFIGLFAWLVPLSATLLVASRCWQRRRGAPAIMHWL